MYSRPPIRSVPWSRWRVVECPGRVRSESGIKTVIRMIALRRRLPRAIRYSSSWLSLADPPEPSWLTGRAGRRKIGETPNTSNGQYAALPSAWGPRAWARGRLEAWLLQRAVPLLSLRPAPTFRLHSPEGGARLLPSHTRFKTHLTRVVPRRWAADTDSTTHATLSRAYGRKSPRDSEA